MFEMLAFGIPAWLESLGHWWVTGIMGIILYWVPLITCLLVYFCRGVKIYFRLRNERVGKFEKNEYGIKKSWFHPDDLTVGHVIGFFLISICPVVNLIAFMIEAAWDVIRAIYSRCEKFFTQPLVPDSEKYQQVRGLKDGKRPH